MAGPLLAVPLALLKKKALAKATQMGIRLFVYAILTIVLLFMILFVGKGKAEADSIAGCASNYAGPGGGAYVVHKGSGYNKTVAEIAYVTARQRGVADNSRVMLALFEAGIEESGFKNYANDGLRGPEDNAGTPSTDAQLAEAKKSLNYPHDAVGTDHASVGFLQQQVGPGFNWGVLPAPMDPAHATGKFLDIAIAKDLSTPGPAGNLAQAVQRSAPARYNKHETEARRFIAEIAAGVAARGSGTAATPVATVPGVTVAPAGPGPSPNAVDRQAEEQRTEAGKTRILLDPGHSGTDGKRIDPASGLLDHDFPNIPEIDNMFAVATQVRSQLQAAGYEVAMTKNSARDSVSHRGRAEIANNFKAHLAISIHSDAQPGNTFENFAEIYVQRVGGYRQKPDGTKVEYTNDPVADKSQAYGDIMKTARQEAEGRPVTVKVNSFDGRTGIAPGNLSLVQLFASVPWVYHEIGAAGGLNAAQIATYSKGLVEGVTAAVPPTIEGDIDLSGVECTTGSADFVAGETVKVKAKGTLCDSRPGDPKACTEYTITLPAGARGKGIAAGLAVLGTPYSWGGGTPTGPSRGFGRGAPFVGFDCSSLMQYIIYNGTDGKVTPPRTSGPQSQWAKRIDPSQAIPGDIVYWPGHIAMYIGDIEGKRYMIAAPSTGDHVKVQPVYGNPSWHRVPSDLW